MWPEAGIKYFVHRLKHSMRPGEERRELDNWDLMMEGCPCVKFGMIDKVSELLQEMRTRGIGHCKAVEIGKAKEFLEMLLELGLKLDIFTFNSIIDDSSELMNLFIALPKWWNGVLF
ncbi:hypothetical protein RJ641_021033 [Dillenia turbinata]|uniref:Pentatricopeptide repeat-containing protein n=1 Tax=Dillenia turbinata TaxID=194707 RepID=A0AAN8YUZ6_9MAGN